MESAISPVFVVLKKTPKLFFDMLNYVCSDSSINALTNTLNNKNVIALDYRRHTWARDLTRVLMLRSQRENAFREADF